MEGPPQGRSRGRARGIPTPAPAGRGERPISQQPQPLQGDALAPVSQANIIKRKTDDETRRSL